MKAPPPETSFPILLQQFFLGAGQLDLGTVASLKSAKLDGKDAPIFLNEGFYTMITPSSDE